MIEKVKNLWEESPYKEPREKSIYDSSHSIGGRVIDVLTKGKRIYGWGGLMLGSAVAAPVGVAAGNREFLYGIPVFMVSAIVTAAGLMRREILDSYNSRKLIDLPGPDFQELEEEYSF